MAIIMCTECGHDVSTHADKCQNCGCPMSVIAGNTNDSIKTVDIILEDAGRNRLEVIRFIQEISDPKKSFAEAENVVDKLPRAIIRSVDIELGKKTVAKLSEIGCYAKLEKSNNGNLTTELGKEKRESRIKSTFLFSKDKPLTCPHCGSTAVTTGSRGYSLVWGFLGSNKTVNRCGKCGHTWNP